MTRLLKLLPAVVLVATVLVPAPAAQAQATRTWVSGVGDDVNPCSRTAPCKTFAGAISKTATGGEINTLDPGGYGTLTITKAITVNACMSGLGGVASPAITGFTVNAPTTAKVTLRCLDINGFGTGIIGVRILAAKSVKIVDSEIYGFTQSAIDVDNTTAGLKVHVARNLIHDNTGVGVMNSPQTGGDATVTLKSNDLIENGCGVVAAQFGSDTGFATECGARNSASGISVIAINNVFSNVIANNVTVGVLSRGATGINRIGLNEITGNVTGLRSVDSGQILSWNNNLITGNGTNGAATGPLTPGAP